jgi:hypothetical protein
MDLCIPGDDLAGSKGYVASVADFAHLYTERPTALMLLCEFVLNSQQQPPHEQLLYHTLLELYLQEALPDEPGELQELQEEQQGRQGRQGQQGDGVSGRGPGGTLELDASSSGGGGGAQQGRREQPPLTGRQQRAVELLQRGWQPHMAQPLYSADHAVMLCRMHGLKEGLALLFDKLRLHREVLQVGCGRAGLHGALPRGGWPRGGARACWRGVGVLPTAGSCCCIWAAVGAGMGAARRGRRCGLARRHPPTSAQLPGPHPSKSAPGAVRRRQGPPTAPPPAPIRQRPRPPAAPAGVYGPRRLQRAHQRVRALRRPRQRR